MKILKKKKRSIFTPITLVIIAILLLIYTPKFFSKADPANADISAVLYDDSSYTTNTALTEAGCTISGWGFGANKYLQIDPIVENNGNTYKVVVELTKDFYVNASELSIPAGYSDVQFTQNETFTINTNQTFDIKPYSGTIEYTLAENQTSASLQIPLTFDERLSGNITGSKLNADGVKPIVVKLKQIDTNGEETIIKTLSVGNATTGTKRPLNSNILYLNGVNGTTKGTMTFDKNANLYITYNTTTLGAQYLYDRFEIRIDLPYYKDLNNQKHYLEVVEGSIQLKAFTNPEYTIDNSQVSNGIYKIIINRSIYTGSSNVSNLFSFKLKLPEELKNTENEQMVFSGGTVKFIVNTLNGTNNSTISSKSIHNITYTKNLLENVDVGIVNSSPNVEVKPESAVSFLGRFLVGNTGTGDSSEKTLTFTFDTENTGKVHVTTINLPVDKVQQYINIEYSLVDSEGNQVYFDANRKCCT